LLAARFGDLRRSTVLFTTEVIRHVTVGRSYIGRVFYLTADGIFLESAASVKYA
jgi:hypothetical protein